MRIFYEIFSGFRAKLQKRVRSVAFQSILRERIRKLPKFLKILKIIIQFYSILFNRVLSWFMVSAAPQRAGKRGADPPPMGTCNLRGCKRRRRAAQPAAPLAG